MDQDLPQFGTPSSSRCASFRPGIDCPRSIRRYDLLLNLYVALIITEVFVKCLLATRFLPSTHLPDGRSKSQTDRIAQAVGQARLQHTHAGFLYPCRLSLIQFLLPSYGSAWHTPGGSCRTEFCGLRKFMWPLHGTKGLTVRCILTASQC